MLSPFAPQSVWTEDDEQKILQLLADYKHAKAAIREFDSVDAVI